MPVKVKVKSGEPKVHPNADLVGVRDGQLVVEKNTGAGNSDSVAIYAPGVWVSAVVEDAQPN
jgi:hypothetical protein